MCAALDELKDTDEDGSKVARIANRWLERACHKGSDLCVRLMDKESRLRLSNTEYPVVPTPEST